MRLGDLLQQVLGEVARHFALIHDQLFKLRLLIQYVEQHLMIPLNGPPTRIATQIQMEEASDCGGVKRLQYLVALLRVLVKAEVVEIQMGQRWIELQDLHD